MSNNISDAASTVSSQTPGERKGFWGRWLNLTAPPRDERTTAGPQAREVLRKAELTGYFLFVVYCFCVLDGIFAFAHPATLIISLSVIFCEVLFFTLVAFLNRKGRTSLAAILLIGCGVGAIMFVIAVVQKNSHAFDLLPIYDFFLYPIVLGSLFLPRRWIWIFTLLSIAFLAYDLFFLPHPPDIERMKGTPTIVLWLLRPASMLVVVAIVGWLGLRSVERSILRADRAEELVAAERQIAAQAHLIAAQRAKLEEEMAHILHVHREAAMGNYTVRAAVQTQGIIWQISRSLNNLLARYEQFAREQQEYATVKVDVEQLARYIEAARRGERLPDPPCRSLAGRRLLYALGILSTQAASAGKLNDHTETSYSYKPTAGLNHTDHDSSHEVPPARPGKQSTPAANSSAQQRRPFQIWRRPSPGSLEQRPGAQNHSREP